MKNKDVIYIDVEDEITSIIDKVNSSKSKVVALVLPKRATVFQSIVNMKLLKKKSTEAKKNVVLVTSEAGILPLAGATGVYVANSLEATPVLPPDPNVAFDDESPVDMADDEETSEDSDQLDNSRPIGELAGLAAVGAAVNREDPEDNIEFDNDSTPSDPMGLDSIDNPDDAKKNKKAKGLNGKSTKVPNFERFRKWLIIGGIALVALILIYIFGFKVLPKAKIIIQTNTSSINTNLSLTLSQADGNLDVANNIVPAKYQTQTKTSTSTSVNTTGSKTIGTSASGSITVTNGGNSSDTVIPAGTVFVNNNTNASYASTSEETLPGCLTNHGSCIISKTVSVPVSAPSVGATYNTTSAGYTSSYSPINGFKMAGTAMAGGSSTTVQAVSQADITTAQSQLTAINGSQMESQLESTIKSNGFMPITATYVAGTPTYTPSAAVGAQANSITVTETATYSMYGVKESDLNTLVLANVNKQINPSTQSILDSGTSNATFTLVSSSTASAIVTMQASSTVGPKLDTTTIIQQSAGQKSADIISSISQVPGVTSVTVKYSPFWVTSTPKNVKKITVVIEKSNGSQP